MKQIHEKYGFQVFDINLPSHRQNFIQPDNETIKMKFRNELPLKGLDTIKIFSMR